MPFLDVRPFTYARIDEQLFGAHNGIQTGPIPPNNPTPVNQANIKPSAMTMRANPWYMAPGWNASMRHIDVRYFSGGPNVPRIGSNPWDAEYGYIGAPPPNLGVIRANQMGAMSFS